MADVDSVLTQDFPFLNGLRSGALYILIEYDKFSSQESVLFMLLCIAAAA